MTRSIIIFSFTVDFSSLGNSWRRWPQGKYSIPMSIYGCPDQELNNWSHGSYNITISTDYTYDLEGVNETGSKFLWDKSDLLLLGPFGTNTFQINFCTRDKSASAPDTKHLYEDESGQRIYLELAEWPRGDYGIFNANVMLSELYQFEPDDTEEIQCPKGNTASFNNYCKTTGT